MKDSAWRDALAPLLASAALFAVACAVRPLIPVDETRYASVAWEMHLRGDWLVPHMNGLPYSHKPPLLFWLIGLGWAVFGVNEFWVRAVPALLSLANVFLVARLARRLWGQDRECSAYAPWIFAGAGLPALFGTVVFFDPLLACCALVAVDAVLRAAEDTGRWLLVYGVALGCGVLAKGPVVLVHALPVACLAPWWSPHRLRTRRTSWYAGVAAAVLLGAAIALAWAIPAAWAGGPTYREELLWGQTADRMVSSFAHRRPFWFYIPQLFLALAPWSLWPPVGRVWSALRRGPPDFGIRFCIAWFVPGFVVLSLVSGKQPQYLLPLLPALALAAARVLARSSDTQRPSRSARLLPVVALGGSGAVLVAARAGVLERWAPSWSAEIPWWGGGALLVGALVLLAWPPRGLEREVPRLAIASLFFLVIVHAAAVPRAMATHDIRGVARYLHQLETEGRPVAHAGTYGAQYQFLGRLERPLAVIEPSQISAWAGAHPDGSVIIYFDAWTSGGSPGPTYVQPYRGRTVTVWPSAMILAAAGSGAPPWE